MEGVTDLPFRLWFGALAGPSFQSTPFLRVTAGFPGKLLPTEYIPEVKYRKHVAYDLVPQLMTENADDFIRVGKLVLACADFVDLNCGCPSPNAARGGAGSSLLANLPSLREYLVKCCDQLGPDKVSIKIRAGYERHDELPLIVDTIKDLPLARVTIHGRTRPQRYDGYSRWMGIAEAADALPMPVFGSGDIVDYESMVEKKALLEKLSGVVIGRGALRNPMVFQEIAQSGKTQSISTATLFPSLKSLACLYELKFKKPTALVDLICNDVFKEPFIDDSSQWEELYDRLSSLLDNADEISRGSLGRVKMIWNYLRSSLEETFFSPQLLRSKNLETLLQGIKLAGDTQSRLKLRHHRNFDWVYTSRKKQPDALDDLF